MGKDCSEDIKNLIVDLRSKGFKLKKIQEITRISTSTISDICRKYLLFNSTIRKPGSGRKNSLSDVERQRILNYVKKNPNKTSSEVLKDQNLNVTARTVRNVLKSNTIKYSVPVKKPYLTAAHKRARLDWAYKNIKNSKDEWNSILWSNESRFMQCGNDGKQKIGLHLKIVLKNF